MSQTQPFDRREHDMEIALRMQKLELEMSTIREEMGDNTQATKELLQAWNTSTSALTFIKGCVVFGAGVAAISVAWHNLWK